MDDDTSRVVKDVQCNKAHAPMDDDTSRVEDDVQCNKAHTHDDDNAITKEIASLDLTFSKNPYPYTLMATPITMQRRL